MNRTINFLFCLLFISQIIFSQNLKIVEPELVFVEAVDFLLGCLVDKDTACFSDEKPTTNVTLMIIGSGNMK